MMGKRGKHGLRPARVVLAAAALALAAALPGVASAGEIQLGLLYDGRYEFEGQIRYAMHTHAPAVLGDRIIFPVGGTHAAAILVKDSQGLRPLMPPNTPVPGGTGVFNDIGTFWVDGDDVAFVGHGTGGETGIYVASPEGVRKVVDVNTPIPHGVGSFTSFEYRYAYAQAPAVTIENGRVAFQGRGADGQGGIYLHEDGQLQRIADQQTQIPGSTSPFVFPNVPRFGGGSVLFFDADMFGILYAHSAGKLEVFFDPPTAFPDNDYPFLFSYSYDGASLAVSLESGQVYRMSADGTRLVADTSLLIPGTTTNAMYFADVVVDGASTAFTGGGPFGMSYFAPGLYWDRDGELYEVAGPTTVYSAPWLVVDYAIGAQGLSGNTLAFNAVAADIGGAHVALYVARYVPEPASSSTMLVGAALALLGGTAVRARRRRVGS